MTAPKSLIIGPMVLFVFAAGIYIGARLSQQAVETALTAEHRVELDRLGDNLAVARAQRDEAMRWLTFEGRASWYGDFEDGQPTANKETFDKNAMTAASPWLPFGTKWIVTYRGRSVIVRINDRLPGKWNRILDLSFAAARELGMLERGVAKVKIIPALDSAIGRPGIGD